MSAPRDPGATRRYGEQVSFLADMGRDLVDLLAPQEAEDILDLGCRDGALTELIKEFRARVVALDVEEESVEIARARGVDARLLRGDTLPFNQEFDAVFSTSMLHWFRDADGIAHEVFRSLRPGGRFVAELCGKGCIARVKRAIDAALVRRGRDPDALCPWYFPSPAEQAHTLEEAGFVVRLLTNFDRPTLLPTGIYGLFEILCRPYVLAFEPEERRDFVEEIAEAVKPELCDAAGRWRIDYRRLRFVAVRPSESGI